MNTRRILQLLLWLGAGFYLLEAVLHGLGLPILEHDKIFLFTHDRYIALYALTYSALLILISTNLQKYYHLFIITLIGIFLSFINAWWISSQQGYTKFFNTISLENDLGLLGIGFVFWYTATSGLFFKIQKSFVTK